MKEEKSLEKQGNPNALMQMAIENKASIEHLEKLMDLQERWEKNEARKAFYFAKAQFQKEKPIIPKSSKVKYESKSTGKITEYSFAPLSDIQKAIDPKLAELGLSYDYKQKEENGRITIFCILSHELGHSETTSLSAPADTSGNKNAIQSIGSTVSYLKRYTLTNAVGLSTEEDNDGQNTMTHQEAKIMKLKVELCELYVLKKSKLKEDQIARLEEIIMNDEVNSYQKSINHLKTF